MEQWNSEKMTHKDLDLTEPDGELTSISFKGDGTVYVNKIDESNFDTQPENKEDVIGLSEEDDVSNLLSKRNRIENQN